MEKKKILVVEDEIIIADNICHALKGLGYEAIEPAINYSEAIELIETHNPDVAVLDIQLSGKKSGIDLAKKINKDYNFPFIFLTSNADKSTLNDAKKVMPSAYLIKPFSKEELYTTIEIVYNNFLMKNQQTNDDKQVIENALFIKERGAMLKLPYDEILYLKSSHVYVEITLKNKRTHLVRGSLNDIINKLNNKFIQVHRSYIVNIDFLQRIDTSSLVIYDEIIPISKKYRESVYKNINVLTSSK